MCLRGTHIAVVNHAIANDRLELFAVAGHRQARAVGSTGVNGMQIESTGAGPVVDNLRIGRSSDVSGSALAASATVPLPSCSTL